LSATQEGRRGKHTGGGVFQWGFKKKTRVPCYDVRVRGTLRGKKKTGETRGMGANEVWAKKKK